jgi:mycothiol synthase
MAAHAESADGVAPLDEATLLALRHHPDRVRLWGDYRGFGLVDGDELALLVMPASRGTGLGRQLYLRTPADADPHTAWSHGDHPAAAALARSRGWERARELWVMRRDLAESAPVHALSTPEAVDNGVHRRRVGEVELRPLGDDPRELAELLRVNAAAFAHHPEQGALDAEGLAERMAEPWFDPAGLIMAWEGDRLLGFHWTKRHSPTEGEVYVVGIAPQAQGRGLGKRLTQAGLDHLAAGGATGVHLYVEGDNAAAVRLYTGLGFARSETHVQYRRP